VRRALALALLALGCAHSSLDARLLPAAPIAFVYRSVEETERVADETDAEPTGGPEQDEIDIKLDKVEKLTGRRTEEDLLRDQQGRVGLFVAPETRLELPESLARGARPLGWSPDRTRLLLTLARHDRTQLFEWMAATGEVRQLTSGPESATDGCYGPDGALVWAQYERSGPHAGTSLWLRRPGESPRRISEGPGDTQPAWAPDGSRIVFTRVENGVPTLRWLDPAGGASGAYGRGRAPTFTPNGEWIIYSGRSASGWQLWRMRADGTGRRNLGASGYQENDPSVSPDGRFVVYSAVRRPGSPISILFVRSIDGAHDRQLEFAGTGLLPVW
jgi:Tol biopolymer transport system component